MTTFVWPWFIALLPLPWIVWRVWHRVPPGQSLHLPQPGVRLIEPGARASGGIAPWLLALAWLSLLVAAARPQWIGHRRRSKRSGRAVMLAVDLSGSMATEDMQLAGQSVSRFGAVEAIAGDFISRRHGDEMGLILFGSQAFLVTPLTFDLSAVRAQLEGSTVGLAGTETAIGDAIAVAVKRLSALPKEARVLVLLTDGVNNAGSIEPREAARAAKAAGVRIYTIGIGATQMQVQGFFGSQTVNPSADLDATMLTQIANETGGRFFRAADSNALADAYRTINALEPMPQHGPTLRPKHELFRWPLLFSIGLILLSVALRLFGGVRRSPE